MLVIIALGGVIAGWFLAEIIKLKWRTYKLRRKVNKALLKKEAQYDLMKEVLDGKTTPPPDGFFTQDTHDLNFVQEIKVKTNKEEKDG